MSARQIPLHLGVPLTAATRAEWVLRTLLAAVGAAPLVVHQLHHLGDDAGDATVVAAPGAADVPGGSRIVLAYAPEPVPGVPTIPASAEALDLLAGDLPLPAGAFAPHETRVGHMAGAFPANAAADAREGFAVPFDLVASAFVLLACWDEHTSLERDQHGRFPYAASVFAANDALDLGRPVVDAYVKLVHALVDEGLAACGREPLRPVSWALPGRDRDAHDHVRFAVALTHDVDGLKRWTARGWLAAGKRTVGAARVRNWDKARYEVGGVGRALTHDIPRRRDPYWTFPEIITQEDALGVSSTFYLLASHGHPTDGIQPVVYHQRLPKLVRLLREARREIGLHGNDRDRIDAAGLAADRADLAAQAEAPIAGIRYHYLRCLYHETLPLLEREGFAYDTSLAFAEREGFRCGFSYPFHPYDLREERPLSLVELPLAVMDSTLQEQKYRGLDAHDALEASQAVLAAARDGGGGAAILWHHNRFHPYVGRGYGDTYWALLDWAREQGAELLPAAELVRRWRKRAGETTL